MLTIIIKRKFVLKVVGDYAWETDSGYILPLTFERKSLGDLFSTLGKGYPRFKKEILRNLSV